MQGCICASPCYNEVKQLPSLLEEVDSTGLALVMPLIFVDDGSTDGSTRILEASGHIRLYHSSNQGYGASVKTAFSYCATVGATWMAVFPADHQRSVADLLRLIDVAETGNYDLVVGNKLHGGNSIPFGRLVGNYAARIASLLLWRCPYRDVLSGFKVYRIDAIADFIHLLPDDYTFDVMASLWVARRRLRVAELNVAARYIPDGSHIERPLAVALMASRRAIREWAKFYARN